MSKSKTVFHSMEEFELEFYPKKRSERSRLQTSDVGFLGQEMAKQTFMRVKEQHSSKNFSSPVKK